MVNENKIEYPRGMIYPESGRLRAIIESHNWRLYDVTNCVKGTRPFLLKDLEAQGPAENFTVGNNYFFAPIPRSGQSLRDAYSVTKGFGPSILVGDIEDERWAGCYLVSGRIQRGRPIIFTRLDFQPTFLGAFTPETRDLPDSDALGVKYRWVIDTFEKFFRIIPPEEEGLPVPMPMPVHLEDN